MIEYTDIFIVREYKTNNSELLSDVLPRLAEATEHMFYSKSEAEEFLRKKNHRFISRTELGGNRELYGKEYGEIIEAKKIKEDS